MWLIRAINHIEANEYDHTSNKFGIENWKSFQYSLNHTLNSHWWCCHSLSALKTTTFATFVTSTSMVISRTRSKIQGVGRYSDEQLNQRVQDSWVRRRTSTSTKRVSNLFPLTEIIGAYSGGKTLRMASTCASSGRVLPTCKFIFDVSQKLSHHIVLLSSKGGKTGQPRPFKPSPIMAKMSQVGLTAYWKRATL